jgi:hypothetical protein
MQNEARRSPDDGAASPRKLEQRWVGVGGAWLVIGGSAGLLVVVIGCCVLRWLGPTWALALVAVCRRRDQEQ